MEELRTLVIGALDEGLISCEESKFILIEHPMIAKFYTLPKIHKGLRGRPSFRGELTDPKC